MAYTLSITMTDAQAVRLLEAIKDKFNYEAMVGPPDEQVPNPETAQQFAKKKIIHYLKSMTINYEDRISRSAVIPSDFDIIEE